MRALFFDKTLNYTEGYEFPKRKSGQALIQMNKAGVCSTDIEIIKGYMNFTGVIGHEFIGTVLESDTKKLEGKRVAGEINCACWTCDFCYKGLPNHCVNRTVLGILDHNGTFAEYFLLPDRNLYVIPDSIPDTEAVFIEPLAAAFQILEQIHIKPRDKIAVLGDGKLGLLIVKVLSLASNNIDLIGKHDHKLQLVQQECSTTYKASDFVSEPIYDIVIDSTGSETGFSQALDMLKPRGTLILKTTVANKHMEADFFKIVVNEITIVGSRCGPFSPAIKAMEKNQLTTNGMIDGIYTLKHGIQALEKAKEKKTVKILLEP